MKFDLLFIISIISIIIFIIILYYRNNIKAYLKNDIISVLCNDIITESIKNKKNIDFKFENLYNLTYNKKIGKIIGIQELNDSENKKLYFLFYVKIGYFNFVKKYFYLIEKNFISNSQKNDLLINTNNLIGVNLTYDNKNIFYMNEGDNTLLMCYLKYLLDIKKSCNKININYELQGINYNNFINNSSIQINKKNIDLSKFKF